MKIGDPVLVLYAGRDRQGVLRASETCIYSAEVIGVSDETFDWQCKDTGSSGAKWLHNEGLTWARGHDAETLGALRAAYALNEGLSKT